MFFMQSSDVEISYLQGDLEYRKARGQSQSHLKTILRSPAHYVSAGRHGLVPSPAMIMGTAVHCKLLEGEDTFAAQFTQRPDGIKFTTKEGKDWRAANSKKKILTNEGRDRQWDSVVGMVDALRGLEWFDTSLQDYRKYNEVSIYWNDNNIACKARLDRVIPLENETLVLDLKTTDNISPTKFQSKVVDLGYDFQAAWYSHAAEIAYGKPVRFIFVAIERSAPYTIDFFEAPRYMINEARYKNEKALRILKECKEKNEWPTRQPSLKLVDYPKWYQPISRDDQPLVTNKKNGFVPLF